MVVFGSDAVRDAAPVGSDSVRDAAPVAVWGAERHLEAVVGVIPNRLGVVKYLGEFRDRDL